jgi:hypothetical protein
MLNIFFVFEVIDIANKPRQVVAVLCLRFQEELVSHQTSILLIKFRNMTKIDDPDIV